MFSHRFNVEEAVERVRKLSYFFFTDGFMQGVAELNEKLGIYLAPIHVRKTEKKYTIAEEEMDRLRKMLEPEYQLINLLKHEHKTRFAKEYSSLLRN